MEMPPRGLRLKIQFALNRAEAGTGGGRVTWLAGYFMAHRVHAKQSDQFESGNGKLKQKTQQGGSLFLAPIVTSLDL